MKNKMGLDLNSSVARRIKEKRIEKGYSQRYMANLMGRYTPKSFSDIENNVIEIKLVHIEQISKILGTSVENLLGFEER